MRLVRCGVLEGGPLVSRHRNCGSHCGWRNDDLTLVGPRVVVRWVRRVERTRLQRCGESQQLAGFELPGVRTWRPCKTGNAGGGR